MKALVNLMLMVAIVVAMNGCAEEAAVQNEPLRFNFKINADDNHFSDLPPGASLLVSLETPSGDELYTLKNIPFEKDGHGYVTSELDLTPGEYILTEFMIADANDRILYTIPNADSPLRESVRTPLGTSLQVLPNGSGGISTELLDVGKFKPADFGLATFNLRNSFQIDVADETGTSVPADVVVLNGEDTAAYFTTTGKKNRLAFDGDLNTTYKLVVSGDGLAPYATESTLSDLIAQYRRVPLKVLLAQAFTMTAEANAEPDLPFHFYVGGQDINISVSWGDGNVDAYYINEPYGIEIAHYYEAPGSYPITITGDLRKIVHFYSFYGGGDFSRISFRNVPNLRELLFGLTSGPATLDLSRNNKLEQAMLPGVRSLQTLILPETHNLMLLEVDGENGLESDDINAIINNLYTNTAASGRREGVFGLRGTWYQDEGDMTMIGPPSAESITLLNSLRNDFGWYVNPSEAPASARVRSTSKLKEMIDARVAARRRI